MKKIRTGLLLLLVILASNNAKAMGTVKVDMVPGEQGKLMVDVLDAPHSPFQVELKDKQGEVIYFDSRESVSYDDKSFYNLGDLKNGKYTFEVNMGHENELNDLVVEDGHVRVVDQQDQISPYFKLDGKYLEFTFPNLEDKSVRVLLYSNDSKNWIFQEKINPHFEVMQALNLSKLKPGSYNAVLISGDGRYNYNFDLN